MSLDISVMSLDIGVMSLDIGVIYKYKNYLSILLNCRYFNNLILH